MVLARFGRRVCAALVLSLIPAYVFAQGATTSTIAGVVKDSSGAVLPGVTVEAASPALIEKVRSAVSDERGQYRLDGLRPGTYTVTFSLAGFATVKHDGLELRSNFTVETSLSTPFQLLPDSNQTSKMSRSLRSFSGANPGG